MRPEFHSRKSPIIIDRPARQTSGELDHIWTSTGEILSSSSTCRSSSYHLPPPPPVPPPTPEKFRILHTDHSTYHLWVTTSSSIFLPNEVDSHNQDGLYHPLFKLRIASLLFSACFSVIRFHFHFPPPPLIRILSLLPAISALLPCERSKAKICRPWAAIYRFPSLSTGRRGVIISLRLCWLDQLGSGSRTVYLPQIAYFVRNGSGRVCRDW